MRPALMQTVLAAALIVATASTASATPAQELDRARNQFRANSFAAAIPLLKDLVYPQPRLARTDEIAEVHILLGSCQFETGNRDDARAEFERALDMQPEAQVDTLLFSTGAVKLFNDTKADVDRRVAADQQKRKNQADAEALRKFRDSLIFFEVHPYYVNFVPFGAGQFQNKERKRGILFAASESVTFAASAGIWIYLVGNYGYGGRVPQANASDVRRLQQVEIGTGAVFLGLAAWGIVDSLLHYQYRARVQGDDTLLPPDLRPRPPTKASTLDRLHFGPLVLPSGLGVGLALEN